MTSNKGTMLRVVCLIGVVCLVCGHDSNASNALKEKRRRERIQQTANTLLFPQNVCNCAQDPCDTAQADINGVCSYLNGQNGCCGTNTIPTDVPPIEPSSACSADCLSAFYSFWCTLPCGDHVDPASALCQSDVDSLFAKCNGCPSFGTYDDVSQYTALYGNRATFSTATGCVRFLENTLIVENAAPVVDTAASSVTPETADLSANTQTVAVTATIVVNQPVVDGTSVPPLFMQVGFTTPNSGNPPVITNVRTLRSEDFEVLNRAEGRYRASHSIIVGYQHPAGTWAVTVTNVNNMFGSQSNVEVATFAITSTFTVDPNGQPWGNVYLCSGAPVGSGTGSHVLQLRGTQTVGDLTCCADSGCEVRCDGTTSSASNVIDSIASDSTDNAKDGRLPITFRDCSINTVNQGTWNFPTETNIVASTVNFVTGATGEFGIAGQTTAIRTPDNSKINIANGATLRQVGVGSRVSMAVNTIFAAGSNLILTNDNQEFSIDETTTMQTAGVINLSTRGQVFTLNPTASDARNQLLVEGQSATIQSGDASNLVRILAGRMEVTNQARVLANVEVGPRAGTPSKPHILSSKFQVATSTPNTFVAEICCASQCSGSLVINPLAALFVIPPEGSQEESCVYVAPTAVAEGQAARIEGSLTLRERSRVVMTGAKENGHHLFVTGDVTASAGALFEVELAPSNTNTEQHEITLMSWAGGSAACTLIEVVVTNKDPTRPPTQYCDTNAGRQRLRVTIPKAKAVVNPTNTAPSFISADTYSITFNKELTDCPETCFTDIIARVTNVDAQGLNVLSYVEKNDITATFRCLSTQSIQHADGICASLVSDARTAGNSLNEQLNVVSTTVVDANDEDDDGNSNTALYGLFGLIAIIPLAILAIFLFMKSKKRKADNQYMQDTATFSNVAASPQPINYPYPYGANGAGEGVVDIAKPPPAYVA